MKNVLSFVEGRKDDVPAVGMVRSLKDAANRTPTATGKSIAGVGFTALGLEGFEQSAAATEVASSVDALKSMISAARQSLKLKDSLSIAQESAGIAAGFMGVESAAGKYLQTAVASAQQISSFVNSSQLSFVVGHEGIAGASEKRVGVEAYDERVNKNTQAYSITYNLNVARQTEFGETFYPTVVISPDSVGLSMQVRLIVAYQEVQRQANGSLNDFKRQNVIRAIIDASILAVQQTQLIPVYRKAATANALTDSFQYFVAAASIAPKTLTVDGKSLTTAPLAIGASFSLLGISQTDAMLAAGLEDQTDAIDSSVRVTTVYLEIDNGSTKEFFSFDVSKLPTFEFFASPQENTRRLILAANTVDLPVSAATKQQDGTASTVAALLSTYTARLALNLNGFVVQDKGDTQVNAGSVTVASVTDSTGTAMDMTTGQGATIVTALASAKVVGYDLLAFRTDSNRRNRGKLLDIQHVNYLYTVPTLPPISALRPVTETDANDGQTLSALITATRVQIANAGIGAILEAESTLQALASQPDAPLVRPKLFGAANALVAATYIKDTINLAANVANLSSSAQIADVQATLVNKIRDMAIRAYVQSEYGPASEAVYEGNPPKTVVLIVTTPAVARYLTLQGDLRLMGDQFEYKLVQTFDARFYNADGSHKVLFSFGHEDAIGSGQPDVLHFGCMAYRPEVTVMLPMVRNGAQSMELTVFPSFRHITNLPVLGSLDVSGITAVMGAKIAVLVNNHVI